MIDFAKIATNMTGLIGFRSQSNIYPSAAIRASSSGLYINDIPGVDLGVINANLNYETIDDYLTRVLDSEYKRGLQLWVNKHKELTRSRTLLDNINFTKDTYNRKTESGAGRLVGIMLKPKQSQHVALLIQKIGTQFTQAQTDLPLYLWCESQRAAIKTQNITTTKNNSLEFTDLTDWNIYYDSELYGNEQCYFIGYFESDLSGLAIDTTLYSNEDCCGGSRYNKFTEFVEVSGFEFASGDLDTLNLPDIQKISLTDQSYGLHLRASAQCDVSNIVIDNKNIFANYLTYKVAERLILDTFNTSRANPSADLNEARMQQNLAFIVENKNMELDNIKFDYTKLDQYCLPCEKYKLKTHYA